MKFFHKAVSAIRTVLLIFYFEKQFRKVQPSWKHLYEF